MVAAQELSLRPLSVQHIEGHPSCLSCGGPIIGIELGEELSGKLCLAIKLCRDCYKTPSGAVL